MDKLPNAGNSSCGPNENDKPKGPGEKSSDQTLPSVSKTVPMSTEESPKEVTKMA